MGDLKDEELYVHIDIVAAFFVVNELAVIPTGITASSFTTVGHLQR